MPAVLDRARACFAGLLLALLGWGCGVTLRAGRLPVVPDGTLEVSELASDRCRHGAPGPESPYREPLPGPVTDPELERYLDRFGPDIRRTAVAAGLEPLLAHVLRERERAADPHSPDTLSLRLELAERINSLETQLTAMEFEVDCIRSLLLAKLQEYEEGETDRQLAYTIASLVVGAGTSLVAGLRHPLVSHVASTGPG